MSLTHTQIARVVTRDDSRSPDVAARSYGEDVIQMLRYPDDFDADVVALQAHCAARFGRMALDEAARQLERETEKNPAAVELGRLGGRAKSQAKTDACRLNGRRPKKPRLPPTPASLPPEAS